MQAVRDQDERDAEFRDLPVPRFVCAGVSISEALEGKLAKESTVIEDLQNARHQRKKLNKETEDEPSPRKESPCSCESP